MPENLKSLIEKIQEEGVRAAEDKASGIEEEARQKADAIIKEAKKKSTQIIADAEVYSKRSEESGKELLRQAARDLLLSLKKEINSTLEDLIATRVKESFSPDILVKIISAIIKDAKDKKGIVVSLNKADLDKLKNKLLGDLAESVRKGITLKPSEEITGGFTISYDEGRSHFDFTDKAISEYIALYVKPQLADILKDDKKGRKK